MWCQIYFQFVIDINTSKLNKSAQHITVYRIQIISAQNNTLKARVFHPTISKPWHKMKQGFNIWCCKK